jgi:hypothetical protein
MPVLQVYFPAGSLIDERKAAIADAVGLSKSGERFKWVRAYFDAKARARAAANYPPDTGGLLPPP